MSSEQPNQSQPDPKPQVPSDTQPTPVSQPKQTNSRDRGFLKTQAIEFLRTTIQTLEGVVETLETPPPPPPLSVKTKPTPPPAIATSKVPTPPVTPAIDIPTPPVTPAIETTSEIPTPPVTPASEIPTPPVTPASEIPTPPVTPASEIPAPPKIPAIATSKVPTATAKPAKKPVPTPPAKPAIATSKVPAKPAKKPVPTGTSQPLLSKLGSVWVTLVKRIRSLLPASVSQQLSDTVLSGAIVTILIVAIGTILNILPGKPPEVAKVPSAEPIVIQPSPGEPSPIQLEPTTLPDALAAPEEPKPVEISPPTPVALTPEQYLIATIQKQVAEITNDFGGGLVKSIQANFAASLLKVKVGSEWYELSETKQNELANQMLKEAQSLDFSKLEINNSQGQQIARSPVIGTDMIILERRQKVEANS